MAYNANNITWNQLAQSLKDRLNIPTLELVNDLTTGGATKAASAETVKTLNTMITDHEKQIANETTPGHVKSSDTLTVDADGTAHAKQVEIVDNTLDGGRTKAASAETVKMLQSEVDGALKVNTYNANSTLMNLGKISARRVFPLHQFSVSDKSEQYALIFPNVFMYGVLKIIATSTYGSVNAAGGCEINVLVGRSKDSTAILLDYNIVSMSPTFANNFFFGASSTAEGITLTFDKKQGTLTLSVDVQYDTVYQDSYNVLQNTTPISAPYGQINSYTPQQSIFTHVGNSKADLATAITGKGVATSADATFATMVANINAIPSGKRQASFSLTPPVGSANFEYVASASTVAMSYVRATVPFRPQFILAIGFYNSTINYLSTYLGIHDGRAANTVKLSGYSGTTSSTTSYNLKGVIIDNGNGTFDFMLPVGMTQITYTVTCFE